MKWNSFTALLLVIFFVSVSAGVSIAYSEEMAIISKAELKIIFAEREFLISELSDFKENYSSLDQKYQALDQKYLDLENESHRQKIESNLRTASLIDLKKTTTWNNVKWFLAGLGVGFAGGEAVGIKIGITLQQ